MNLPEKIQKLRQDKNLTQEQLAEQLYVSRTAISKWESGRGYPSIDSLKAISRLFSVTIDELLSNDELIIIAENENREKTRNIKTVVFGVLDFMVMLLLFLPIFGQKGEHMIASVSLLSLTIVPAYIKITYLLLVILTTLWGVITLTLQSFQNSRWVKSNVIISLFLSITGTLFFIASMQPYAAVFIFFLLLSKGVLLIKRQ